MGPARRGGDHRDRVQHPRRGLLAYHSIVNADFAVIEGTVLLAAMFIIIANIVVDIVYAYLDPRVRYCERAEPLPGEDLRSSSTPRRWCTPSTGSPTRYRPDTRSGRRRVRFRKTVSSLTTLG